jgi:hypothetical protein
MDFAHPSSAEGVFGAHTKIRRRLGVSPEPVGLNGPVRITSSMCG